MSKIFETTLFEHLMWCRAYNPSNVLLSAEELVLEEFKVLKSDNKRILFTV